MMKRLRLLFVTISCCIVSHPQAEHVIGMYDAEESATAVVIAAGNATRIVPTGTRRGPMTTTTTTSKADRLATQGVGEMATWNAPFQPLVVSIGEICIASSQPQCFGRKSPNL
jgi:hypothetical protein